MKLSLVAQFLLSASLAVAQELSHPACQPPLDHDKVSATLDKNIRVPQHHYTVLDRQLPKACYDLTASHGQNPALVRTINVTYADCPGKPWLLCHHIHSNLTADEFVANFGRIPVTARSATKHWLSVPSIKCHGVTYSALNTITFGNCGISVFLHENAHANDVWGFPIDGRKLGAHNGYYSSSARWEGAYNKDTKVITEYARNNFAEDLAEMASVAVYNANVQGGAKYIVPQHKAIYWQLRAYTHFRALTRSIGNCPYRHQNDPLVGNGA